MCVSSFPRPIEMKVEPPMSADTRVDELLAQWEELRRQGRAPSVEELCRDSPELADELARRVQRLRSLDPYLLSTFRGNEAAQNTRSDQPASCKSLGELRPELEPVPGYSLDKILGRGGFGEVWKAVAPGGVPVAMKFIRLDEKVGSAELKSLEIVKPIRHPNLLATFAYWQTDDYLVVAMELADRTLMDHLREVTQQGQPGIPRDELLEYFREAAKGIDFLNAPQTT